MTIRAVDWRLQPPKKNANPAVVLGRTAGPAHNTLRCPLASQLIAKTVYAS